MYSNFFVRPLLLVVICLAALTLKGQYYFDKLTEENGLSDNRVTSILTDKTGFLWIGTKNGLNRYDGNTFRVFRPTAGNSISSEEINDMVQDSSGKIWIATMNGLNIYNPVTDHWQTMLPTGSDLKGDLPSYLIWDLFVDEKNQIWIVSDVWELSVFNPATQRFSYFDWPSFKQQPQFEAMSRYRSIQKMVQKNRKEFWLGTTIGLFSLNTETGKFAFHGSGFNGSIKDLMYDGENGKAFLITEHGNLFCYDEKNVLYKEITIKRQSYPAHVWKKPRNTDVLHMAHPEGMVEINKSSGDATLILHQPALASSLLPGGTNIIYTATDGMTWAGTNNGINFYNKHNQAADFIPLATASDKQSTDGMSAVYYDETDNKYFITSISSKEVFIIDRLSGEINSIKAIDGKLLSPCTNICTDRQNNIWLLTETNVYRYDRQQKQFHLFPTPNKNEPISFHDLLQDNKGDYWLATWRNGVYRYSVSDKKFQLFTDDNQIPSMNITALMNDPVDESVWIGSFNAGLYNYNTSTGKVTNYSETPANREYLQLNLIRDLEKDATGKLWLVTYGAGIYFYQHGKPYEKALTHITPKEGLTNSSYYSLASDNKNRLWLLSGKELSVIDSSGQFLYEAPRHPALSFANYAPDLVYPKRIFYSKSHNELLIPVAGGLLIYYPDKLIPQANFPIVFTDISVGGRSVMYDSSFAGKGKAEIPYKFNSLSFRFAALSYAAGKTIHYEYKLHGSDSEWKTLGSSNSINFPDLSPGHYTFMVRARDESGHISSNTVSFSFHIIPPFWKTWWFIGLIALAIGYGIYQWTLYMRRKIKAQKILNYFATSLYGQNTVEDIFWDVAKNCIRELKFQDCMVYLYDPQRKVLMQKAAYGPKNPDKHEIINALDIPLGKGIVGTVAETGKAEIIRDTSKDSRYIVDDERRYSEITVPIIVDGKVFGIIDSEHPRKNYYRKYHLRILKDIAAVCSDKISKYIIEERLRSKISRDLHDEIGSALTSINVLSKVALSKAANDAEINNYLSKIKESTFRTMESMSDIVWAINPKNDKLEALMSRMKEFAADICEAQGINLEFILPPELEKLSVDLAKRKNLFLVFKEAVNNAVKYSGCTLMRIEFERKDDLLQMVITDNGKGFDKSTVPLGNGLHNMQERAAECNGVLQVKSAKQQGTSIILEIPITFFGVSTDARTQ